MASLLAYLDRAGNTLTVWLGKVSNEYVCEQTAHEVVLMKDRAGNVRKRSLHAKLSPARASRAISDCRFNLKYRRRYQRSLKHRLQLADF